MMEEMMMMMMMGDMMSMNIDDDMNMGFGTKIS
jgi:hypothetical protein